MALLIVGIVCALTGSYFAERLHKRVIMLEKTELMLSVIYNEIKYISLPAVQLVDLLSTKSELKELKFVRACRRYLNEGYAFPESWKKSLSASSSCSLNRSDTELIISFGENFGTTDNDGQLSKCALYLELLKSNYNEAVNNYSRYSKLFKSLGVLAGLSVIILFY